MSSSNESPHVTPVLDKEPQNILDISGGKDEYEKFINDMIKGNLKKQSVPITLTQGPGGEQGIGYHRKLEAAINKCFPNLVPATPALRVDGEKAEHEFQHVYRTDVHDELISKDKLVNVNCVFQVRLTDGTVNLDILIHRSNLYLVGYKCKVGNWILLSGLNYKTTVDSVKAHSTVEAKKAKLGMAYAALFGESDSKFEEDVLNELSRNFDEDLPHRLGKARIKEADVKEKKEHTEKILNDGKKEWEKILNDGKKEWEKMKKHSEKEKEKAEKANKKLEKMISSAEMLLGWLPKKYNELMAKEKLEVQEGTKAKNLRKKFEDDMKKFQDLSRARSHVESTKKEQKEVIGMEKFLDWLPLMLIARQEDEKFDEVGGTVKVLRDYLKADIEKLQKRSILAAKLKKKLAKKVSQAGVDVQKSVVARELLSWVEESKKGVDILSLVEKELEREKNSVNSEKKGEKELEGEKIRKPEEEEGDKEVEGEKITKPEEEEGDKELKTELAALKNLVKKLKKRFSVGRDISQVQHDGFESHEKLKRATKCLHDEVKTHQYSQVPTKDRTDFRNELKYEADMLNTAKKGLAIDAECKIVRAKMGSLKLINRDALRKAFKHLTENPFKDDGHFAGHIITLILMICEAARSKSITDHIRDYYEESNEDTEPLTSQMIAMIYKWTEGSNILTRGVIYKGEVRRWADDSSMDSAVELKNVQTVNGRSDEECLTE